MKMDWNLQKLKIDEVFPNEQNPRRISKRQTKELKESLRKFGLCQPIVVNDSGKVLGGHQRLKLLRSLGYTTIDVYVPSQSLTQEEEEELSIRLNKNVGDWDYDILANSWDPEKLCEWGFTAPELDIDLHALTGNIPDEEGGPLSKNPISKVGDFFQFGDHTLLCGDCTLPHNVQKLVGINQVDMLCTDPPYGVNYAEKSNWLKKYRPSKNDHLEMLSDKESDYRVFFYNFLYHIPWSRYNTAYIFMSGQHLHDIRLATEDADMKWGDYLVWVKNHFVLGRKDYNSKHELIYYGWKGKHKFHGPNNCSTILEYDRSHSSPEHPTIKPISLVRKLIEDGSNEDDNVYDPFLGSGTTLLACEMTPSRRFIGMELEPAYCDLALRRWSEYRKEKGKDFEILINGNPIDAEQLACA